MEWTATDLLMRHLAGIAGPTAGALLMAVLLGAAACVPGWADAEGTIVDDGPTWPRRRRRSCMR